MGKIKKVSAIILAAGQGTRIGKQKMLLPWGKATILERVIGNVLLSGVAEVVVVLGYQAEEMRNRLEPDLAANPDRNKVRIIINPAFKEGISSSLIRGIESVGKDSDAVMIVLGDQPQIGPDIMRKIIKSFIDDNKGIAVPSFKGQRGHPVIIDMKFRPEILTLKGDIGAREVVKFHPEEVLQVDISSQEIIRDIDTWRDYEEMKVASGA